MISTQHAGMRGYSVVIEMENAATVCWSEVGRTLAAVAEQIPDIQDTAGQASSGTNWCKPQVILVHPGRDDESAELVAAASAEVPQLAEVARLSAMGLFGGRYYELKNAGIARADGELIVLLDSDAVPEAGWLRTLLEAFERPETIVVNGHTYLGYSDLISRTLAMIWVFPLREHDARAARRRSLNANNCAFRAKDLGPNPFPIDNGFKVGCTKFMKGLAERGIEMVRVPAYAEHAPLTGWRFLAWRALVTGRDADRKVADLKSTSRWRRLTAAWTGCLRMQGRVVRRVVEHYRHVGMPLWQAPMAIALGLAFFAIALAGQILRLLGLAAERPEYIPAYAEHH
jgi:hypothetical protein